MPSKSWYGACKEAQAMETLVVLFIHLLLFAAVFGLLYWIVVLVCGALPPPVQNAARAIGLILLALMAILFLLGEFGAWGTWGWGYHRHW